MFGVFISAGLITQHYFFAKIMGWKRNKGAEVCDCCLVIYLSGKYGCGLLVIGNARSSNSSSFDSVTDASTDDFAVSSSGSKISRTINRYQKWDTIIPLDWRAFLITATIFSLNNSACVSNDWGCSGRGLQQTLPAITNAKTKAANISYKELNRFT